MNTSLFIAKRLYNAKENNNNYTRPIIRIAISAIALSVAIMILSVFVLLGFKSDISNKVFGFGGHINILKFSFNQSYENDPINYNTEMSSQIESMDFVNYIQAYATKAGIIQMTKYFSVNAILDGADIRINAIAPGGIYNPNDPQGKEFIKNYSERCPMGRLGETHEIIGPALFLISSESSYINGHTLVVDGGMTAW